MKIKIYQKYYILEKDDNLGYNLSTHGDIKKYHIFQMKKKYYFFHFHFLKLKK